MEDPFAALAHEGQSVWYDNISRTELTDGTLQGLIAAGIVRGVTNNPTIFEKAISGSTAYDSDIQRLDAKGLEAKTVYEALAMDDVRSAADLLQPVHTASRGSDGFVSLEVSPRLAHDAEGSVAEAKRLYQAIDRSNAMIKIPATAEGCLAIEELIATGVPVNVTLMFSQSHYDQAAHAYIRGLERALADGRSLEAIPSVASVFVSRIDVIVDALLQEQGARTDLLGKAAIANAKILYHRFREVFTGPQWETLAARGANVQRPLWASTSTKNPAYRDVMYVEELIGPQTVSTMPPKTIEAFRDHGCVARTIDRGLAQARTVLSALAEAGIDMEQIGTRLQEEGIAAFDAAFAKLLKKLDPKM